MARLGRGQPFKPLIRKPLTTSSASGTGLISLDIAVAGVGAGLGKAVGAIALDIAVAGIGAGTGRGVGAVALNITVAGTGLATAYAAGTVGLDIAVAGTGAGAGTGVGAVALDIYVAGVATAGSAAGSIGLDIDVAGAGASSGGLLEDTHDGDYHKKLKELFDKENQRDKRKREDIIAAYERIVEGKPELAKELTAEFEIKSKSKYNKDQVMTPRIDFDKFIKDLNRVEQLWNQYLEMEDEDLMVLL
jgi:hypothetical protein